MSWQQVNSSYFTLCQKFHHLLIAKQTTEFDYKPLICFAVVLIISFPFYPHFKQHTSFLANYTSPFLASAPKILVALSCPPSDVFFARADIHVSSFPRALLGEWVRRARLGAKRRLTHAKRIQQHTESDATLCRAVKLGRPWVDGETRRGRGCASIQIFCCYNTCKSSRWGPSLRWGDTTMLSC